MTFVAMLMLIGLAWILTGLWIISETDFVLMIMRMTNKNFINIHDYHKCKHCNNHGKWEITIAVKVTIGCGMLI